MAVVSYSRQAGLTGREDEVLLYVLPEDQRERLRMQIQAVAPDLGGGEEG